MIGQKIKYLRTRAFMTQKELGVRLGFKESNADVRIAQYENGKRTPKNALVEDMARIFGVSVEYLNSPEISTDTPVEVMHILFSLQDAGIIKISRDSILLAPKDKYLRRELKKWCRVYNASSPDQYKEWCMRYGR